MPAPVTFLAVGSRGDVEPLAVLAGAAIRRGLPATVVAVDDYADLVRAHGAAFVGLGPAMAQVEAAARQPLGRAAFRVTALQPLLLRRWLAGLARAVDRAVDAVPEGSLVVSGLAARDVALALAEHRACRMATVLHTAVLPTARPDSHLEGRRFTGHARLDRAFTAWYWQQVSSLSTATSRVLRRRLPPRRRGASADAHPIWVAADEVLVPSAADWPGSAVQVGAIRPAPDPEARLPAGIEEFLAAGERPVHVGLGSFNDAGGTPWLDRIVVAARASGRRVLTPAPPGMAAGPVDERVFVHAPLGHDLLFPRLAGVVHHGGAGTTAAAMRAGVPTVAVPALFDQPYHAARLHALGLGPAPIPLHRLGDAALAHLLSSLDHRRYAARAAEVAALATGADGTARLLVELERLATAEPEAANGV